ncbi:type III secretion protein HrpV [Pseudomonas sp. CDFA 602]|uniref:type III secretion protein HrpV n=1 Tax=Pseudomonas californiensis TaxID=2829823 RepID=UPI001E436094|nr:type III secretion protein HrpV [Pseudomonas californiensis]MCD5993877.1 type III secretion protein HrpV [Pseudomonas californiensis]MCD5999620.1 type III secretion protein HrpV [Pseudomonas californiensis]
MIEVTEKVAFYTQVASQSPAVWPVANGVAFVSRREHHDWGIALHIEGRALRPEQLREALQLRFSEAERFSNYFLFLDVQRDFVVWHAVSDAPNSVTNLDDIRRHELILAGLDHLA